jgi:hypothetical protein
MQTSSEIRASGFELTVGEPQLDSNVPRESSRTVIFYSSSHRDCVLFFERRARRQPSGEEQYDPLLFSGYAPKLSKPVRAQYRAGVTEVQRQVFHPVKPWMAATLTGWSRRPVRYRGQSPCPARKPPLAAIQQEVAQTDRERIDKSVLAFPELRRHRDKAHLRFVARQPCLICARQPCDATIQRRIHCTAVPGASPRTAPRRQRGQLVGQARRRRDLGRSKALD